MSDSLKSKIHPGEDFARSEQSEGGKDRSLFSTKEAWTEYRLDETLKKINQFQRDQAFNKVSIREIAQKQKELYLRKNHRLRGGQ